MPDEPTTTEEEPREPGAVISEATGGMNVDLLRRLASLIRHKRELKSALASVNEQIDQLQEPALNEMVSAGVDRLPLRDEEGTLTLYIHRQLWARPVGGPDGRPAVVEALQAEGMDDFVKQDFNVQRLSAYARELERAGAELPEQLRAVLEITTDTEVRGRAS